jgi:hypothetical protein
VSALRRYAVALAVASGAVAPAPLAAQAFVDQGVFVITRNGEEIGREEYAIRSGPDHQGVAGLLAVETVRYRDRELRAALELTGNGAPVSYQLEVNAAGRLVERLRGQFGRGRFAVRTVTPSGETAREFPVPPGTIVLDDDTFDQYCFLPRPTGALVRPVTVLRPRESRVETGSVRSLGPDTVAVGTRSVPAEHYALTLESGERREFWLTAAGSLLQVAIPSRSLVATRASLPAK